MSSNDRTARQNTFLSTIQIDRSSSDPIYYQIKERILEAISEDILQAGDLIPSERTLVKQLQVSRMTVRRALSELVVSGMLLKRPGKGTYVHSHKVEQTLVRLGGLSSDMTRSGHSVKSEVIRAEIIPAEGKLIERLQLEAGAPVAYLERLRFVDNEPTSWERTYLPERLCPHILRFDFTRESLYRVLRNEYHIRLCNGLQFMEAVPSNWREQQLLEMPAGAPVFLSERTVRTDGDVIIEYSKGSYRGDRYRYEVRLLGDQQDE